MLPNSPIEQISRELSDLEKRIERLERLDQVFTINPGETVINEAGIDRDLRVESAIDPNLLFLDASADAIGIGTNAPAGKVHALLDGIKVTAFLAENEGARCYFIQNVASNVVTQAPLVSFRRSRGTIAARAAVLAGDFLGLYESFGYDGAALAVASVMQWTASQNWAVGVHGTRFRFFITLAGTALNVNVFELDSTEITFNETSRDIDVRIEGDGDPNLFFTDAGNDNIGIGTNAPNASAKLEISSTTGSLLIPRMTTVQRNALGAVNGMGIYNTTTNQFEKYEAGAWAAW